jgi:hypothetical protein
MVMMVIRLVVAAQVTFDEDLELVIEKSNRQI